METPVDGIYNHISMDDYRSWDAIASSDLSALRHSPARYQYRKTHPSAETPAQKLGTAAHAAVLEPELFASTYQLAPQPTDEYRDKCERNGRSTKGWTNTKAYHEAAADLEAHGHTLLKQADLDASRAIAAAVASHPIGRDLMAASIGTEVSVLATDPEGRRRKIRPDVLIPSAGMIVDIKTARDPRPEAFARDSAKYGYHRSAHYYLDTMMFVSEVPRYEHYVFFAVCPEPPYEIGCYTLNADAMELGLLQTEALLEKLTACETANSWPAHNGQMEEINLPGWVYAQWEKEELNQ